MSNRPNLFSIATKELSQDAFFTWLILFADKKCEQEDHLLNKCAKEFVSKLIKTKYPSFDEQIEYVEAERQWGHIDIVATVNNTIMNNYIDIESMRPSIVLNIIYWNLF